LGFFSSPLSVVTVRSIAEIAPDCAWLIPSGTSMSKRLGRRLDKLLQLGSRFPSAAVGCLLAATRFHDRHRRLIQPPRELIDPLDDRRSPDFCPIRDQASRACWFLLRKKIRQQLPEIKSILKLILSQASGWVYSRRLVGRIERAVVFGPETLRMIM